MTHGHTHSRHDARRTGTSDPFAKLRTLVHEANDWLALTGTHFSIKAQDVDARVFRRAYVEACVCPLWDVIGEGPGATIVWEGGGLVIQTNASGGVMMLGPETRLDFSEQGIQEMADTIHARKRSRIKARYERRVAPDSPAAKLPISMLAATPADVQMRTHLQARDLAGALESVLDPYAVALMKKSVPYKPDVALALAEPDANIRWKVHQAFVQHEVMVYMAATFDRAGLIATLSEGLPLLPYLAKIGDAPVGNIRRLRTTTVAEAVVPGGSGAPPNAVAWIGGLPKRLYPANIKQYTLIHKIAKLAKSRGLAPMPAASFMRGWTADSLYALDDETLAAAGDTLKAWRLEQIQGILEVSLTLRQLLNLSRAWHEMMHKATAAAAVDVALRRARSTHALGSGNDWEPMLKRPWKWEKVRLIEITSADGLIEEAKAMGSCVASYDYDCLRGMSRLFSVRESDTGRRLATAQIQNDGQGLSQGDVAVQCGQVEGQGNTPAPHDAVRAVQRFIVAVNQGSVEATIQWADLEPGELGSNPIIRQHEQAFWADRDERLRRGGYRTA